MKYIIFFTFCFKWLLKVVGLSWFVAFLITFAYIIKHTCNLNKYIIILCSFLFVSFFVNFERACASLPINRYSITSVDSIISNVIECAPSYETIVHDYRAHLYVKGLLDMKKKNFTFRYLPKMFRAKRGVNEYLIESHSELHYTSPNIYDQKILATYGTTSGSSFQSGLLD